MKEETKKWLEYSNENLESAEILFKSHLYNPCLQNAQQAVEKSLKSLLIEFTLPFKKIHSINELKMILSNSGIIVDISDEDCDLLDSIYLPSKYPLGSVLPDFEPDTEICKKAILIAEKVLKSVTNNLEP